MSAVEVIVSAVGNEESGELYIEIRPDLVGTKRKFRLFVNKDVQNFVLDAWSGKYGKRK